MARPDFERRFAAPALVLPSWSPAAPDRCVVMSSEPGSVQAFTWDPTTGARRMASQEPVGLLIQEGCDATPTADGSGVIWFSDTTGDESGRYLMQPWDGGDAVPLLPDVPEGWYSGLALGKRTIALGMGYDDGFRIYVSVDGEPARLIHEHAEELRVPMPEWGGFSSAGLSADESLLAIAHTESGLFSYALRIYDVASGQPVAELDDGEDMLFPAAWSPIVGDQRLAMRQEKGNGFRMPAIWDLATGERTDLVVDLAGEVDVYGWWPDASALLLAQMHDGRSQLWRYDLDVGALTRLEHPTGCVWGAQVRPDGSVWLCHDSGATSTRILEAGSGAEVYVPTLDDDVLTTGRPFETFTFTNRSGERIQGFVVKPEGDGPFPFVMDIHGGPDWFWGDYWAPKVQAKVDAGYAVGLINYRGSAGCGRDFRNRLVRDIGFPETEDLDDGMDYLIAEGIADPERLVLAGKSWGGYLTLLGIGMHPERWKAAVADVPVADYAASYEDSAPSLQAMDRAYLGAPPTEIPEFITPRSPITYVDRVACPLFIIYGENDSRCPPRQVENYVAALRAVGGNPEVHKYGTGHSSAVTDEEIAHIRLVLAFLEKHVPTR